MIDSATHCRKATADGDGVIHSDTVIHGDAVIDVWVTLREPLPG